MEIGIKRRLQIFLVGIAPLFALTALFFMASAVDLNIVDVFTEIDRRDPDNLIYEVKIGGVVVESRPATQADVDQLNKRNVVVRSVVLSVTAAVILGSFIICLASITGRPQCVLLWCDKNLGSIRDATPSLRRRDSNQID